MSVLDLGIGKTPSYVHEPASNLGFPEFESIHLTDFSIKAQLSKSVASTIPPRPHNFKTLRLTADRVCFPCLFHHQLELNATQLL